MTNADPLAWTPSHPPGGGRGVGDGPFPHGKGWGLGGVETAAVAVRRHPGPPREDPPTSPPRRAWGARGGIAVGRLAHRLPPTGGAAQRRRLQAHAGRRLRDRRATKRSDWRGGRAGTRTCAFKAARLRAWRVAGVTSWWSAQRRRGAAPRAWPPGRQAGASFTRSVKDISTCGPGHGKGRPSFSTGVAGRTQALRRQRDLLQPGPRFAKGRWRADSRLKTQSR